jgi:hypothetical protein
VSQETWKISNQKLCQAQRDSQNEVVSLDVQNTNLNFKYQYLQAQPWFKSLTKMVKFVIFLQ